MQESLSRSSKNKGYKRPWHALCQIAVMASLVAATGIWASWSMLSVQRLETGERIEQNATGRAEREEIHIVFVGDVMLSRKIGELMANKNDYRFPFLKIASTTGAADIVFANLESPLSSRGVKSGSIYSFRADPRAMEGLTFAGVTAVSVANNHIWDYGRHAFEDTVEYLLEKGIAAVGGGKNYEEAHAPKIITVGKTRVAFLAYTNLLPVSLGLSSSTPAVARFDDETLKTDIAQAKELSDFLVVSFHWGDEYRTKRNAEQERVAKLSIDAGADIIVGHHPHVVEEVEEYNGGWIAYSLGNFIFDQNFSEDTRRGLALDVAVKDDKIIEVTKREIAFTADYQPYVVEKEEAE